jgi:hypothetical protein
MTTATAPRVMRLYLDDSGTRHPDHDPGRKPAHEHDWFGLGGVIVRETEELSLRARHAALCSKWNISYPLHSAEIRACSQHFTWLGTIASGKKAEFMADLGELATSGEITAIACVIDRPGYNHRYREKHQRGRWLLCKTAFTIVVERAAKFAREHGCRLRVYVEQSDKETDKRLRGYFDEMRTVGHPFDQTNASKYAPLTAEQLGETLFEFRPKNKSSPVMQVADLCLWPMCIGGYDPKNRAYVALKTAGTLIDCKLPDGDVGARGIKYSCWDLIVPR